jgi:hypothetical protein
MAAPIKCIVVNSYYRFTVVFAGMLLIIATFGCGNRPERTYPTRIKLQLPGGKPAIGARITLRSVDTGVSARGVADANGIARMTTFKPEDGAVPGRHMVAIGPPAIEGDSDVSRPSFSFAQRFSHFDSSKVEFEVSADKANEFEVLLTSK